MFLYNYRQLLLDNIIFISIFFTGIVLLMVGLLINIYNKSFYKGTPINFKFKFNRKIKLVSLDKVNSIFPLNILKEKFISNLSLTIKDPFVLNAVSNILVIMILFVGLLLVFLLRNVGQLWYVKILLFVMGIVLPYYIISLIFDLFMYNVNSHIPKMIDEFRSAFINSQKVRPALKTSSLHINKSLGKIISNAADNTFIENSLLELRDKFNNTWFNLFVVVLVNFKDNGGDLIDQLYKLNNSMTIENNVEKKKNKRLIWYELFAVSTAICSIPAVIWLNRIILGEDANIINPQTNILISLIIVFSILALIIIRILRKV